MPTTLADLEAELIHRAGPRIDRVRLPPDGTSCLTDASPRPYLGGALAEGARDAGLALAGPFRVTDADLAALSDAAAPKLADLAELRLYLTMRGRWSKVDTTTGTDSQKWSQFADELDAIIKDLRAALQAKYGYGLGTLMAGRIRLGNGRPRCRPEL
jgi:hypothetical protein